MTTIYLKHPKHGTKVATQELEAQFDESHGWVRYTIDASISDEAVPEVNTLEVARRGRPRKVITTEET